MKYSFLVFMSVLLFSTPSQSASKTVVVSIKPLHSLVAAIMQGDDNAPVLLVDGKQSVHNYTLKPSQREALEHAAVVFYMGDSFETFMSKTLAALPKSVRRIPMESVQTLTLFPMRKDGGSEEDDDHHVGTHDLHAWLSVLNAKFMVAEITSQLARTFPERKELYFNNMRQIGNRLGLLDKELEPRMSRLRSPSFIVFHDAYQYFEKYYGLNNVGSITVHPEQGVSVKHIKEIRDKIQKARVVCAFSEPQFDSKIVASLIEGTQVKSRVLDPEGALLEPGPELYFQLIEGLAKGMEECLS